MGRVIFSLFLFIFVSLAQAGSIIPDFSLEREDGKIVKRDDLKGKPSVLIFFGVGCHSCKKELPMLNKIYLKYKDKVQFYAIVIDSQDPKEIKEIKEYWGFDIPVLITRSRAILYKYHIFGVPTILIVDENLRPYKKFFGVQENKVIEKYLKKLLNEEGEYDKSNLT